LSARPDQRERAPRRQVAGLELRLAAARELVGGRHVAQGAAGAAAPVAPGQRPLNSYGAVGVDQLLGDRPCERLEGLRAAERADPRLRANHRSEQPIALEGTVEGPHVVVQAE